MSVYIAFDKMKDVFNWTKSGRIGLPDERLSTNRSGARFDRFRVVESGLVRGPNRGPLNEMP